jgi:uncharacterized phage-associated protein
MYVRIMTRRPGYLLTREQGVYARSVPASASAVASEIRRQLPIVKTKQLHKLLYYCQGMHLAWFDERLFRESISAWDMGPVVGQLWKAEKEGLAPLVDEELDETQRNTIAYVVSRYGGLSGRDLELLSHAEDPWRRADVARSTGGPQRIETDWLRDWFLRDIEPDEDAIPSDRRRDLLSGAVDRRQASASVDRRESLLARLNR